ncbi:hypothetical protein [Frigoribacterium sp. PvP054]|uniref:hypothetical protein n=1 Tax=Frigoribacterium sp. PvP054 TaxID=3156438 RepID=UPI00339A9B11
MTDGTITLNEGAAPYVQASLTLAFPRTSTLAAMDPTAKPRVTLTTQSNGVTRTFDLLLSARQPDFNSSTVGVNLVSDEAFLLDYAPSADDRTNWARQASVRSIVQAVLSKAAGTTVLSGAANSSYVTYSQITNLIQNTGGENGSDPWAGTNATVDASSNWKHYGTYSIRVTASSTSSASYAWAKVSASAGSTYTISGFYRQVAVQTGTVNGDARKLQIVAVVDGNTVIIGRSNQGSNAANTTTQLIATFKVPDTASEVMVRLVNGSGSASNSPSYFDGLLMTEGDGNDTNGVPLVVFDGSNANNTAYTYTWDGTGDRSSSTRTPVVDRDPESLTWSLGQTAWDFLQPILQAVGMRLFCDENRTWWLVANDYAVDGVVRISAGDNAYSGSDLMSRTATGPDGAPINTDAVFVHFTWRDKVTGLNREKWDIAAPAGYQRPYIVERPNKPYTGPGTAAYLLSRYKARRRTQNVTAAIDYSVTPGQEVAITLPGMDLQSGYVDAVSWSLTADEMTVYSKGLVTAYGTSYNQQPDSMTYASLPDTTTYTSFPN